MTQWAPCWRKVSTGVSCNPAPTRTQSDQPEISNIIRNIHVYHSGGGEKKPKHDECVIRLIAIIYKIRVPVVRGIFATWATGVQLYSYSFMQHSSCILHMQHRSAGLPAESDKFGTKCIPFAMPLKTTYGHTYAHHTCSTYI